MRFYSSILGCLIKRREKEWAVVDIGGAEVHLYLHGGVSEGVEFAVQDIKMAVRELSQKGVLFVQGMQKPQAIKADKNNITEFPWGKSAYFHDSEGNRLALVQDYPFEK